MTAAPHPPGPPPVSARTYLPLIIAMVLGVLSLAAVVIWVVVVLERNAEIVHETDAKPFRVLATHTPQPAPVADGGAIPTPAVPSPPPHTPEAAAAVDSPVAAPAVTEAAGDSVSTPPPAEAEPVATAPPAVVAKTEDEDKVKLVPAPAVEVTEDTATGPLPVVADNGKKPWLVYSRPFNVSDQPRVALVVYGLGLSKFNTTAAIDSLPHEVTLALDAQSPILGSWMFRARQVGHETILEVPMEPFDYPRSDPGPGTLLTNLPVTENLTRLLDAMRRSSGYIGITTLSGSEFTTTPQAIEPVLRELNYRGLMFFDAKAAPLSVAGELARNLGMPYADSNLRIDNETTAAAIDKALQQLSLKAQQAGKAVGAVAASPLAIERINRWAEGLAKQGIVLAPLSAVTQ